MNISIKNLLVIASVVAMMTGCAQMGENATKGALIGGAGAAGVTALVGGSKSSVATAAAIGAVAGGVIGDKKDQNNK